MRLRSSTPSPGWRSTSRPADRCIGNIQGGLSGPAIKPIALLKVKEVYEVAGPAASRSSVRAASATRRCARVHHRRCDGDRHRHGAILRAAGVQGVNRGSPNTYTYGLKSISELVGSLQLGVRARDAVC